MKIYAMRSGWSLVGSRRNRQKNVALRVVAIVKCTLHTQYCQRHKEVFWSGKYRTKRCHIIFFCDVFYYLIFMQLQCWS